MKTKEFLIPALLLVVILGFSIKLHTAWCGTPLNLSAEKWQTIVDFHADKYPYNIRLLTTPIVIAAHKATGLSLMLSFAILQFTLMFVLGLVFYLFLRLLALSRFWSCFGMASLMLAMPLFYAISEPMHTWDDIWGYLFLTLCASALAYKRFYLAGFWFLAACFAREQTLIYYPAYAAGVLYLSHRSRTIRTIAAVIAPLLIFGTYFALVWQNPESVRYHLLAYNFNGALRTRDSIYSIFMAFGWLWIGWLLSLVARAPKEIASFNYRMLKYGALYAVMVTTFFGCGFTLVRETRILFPPAILVIPSVMILLQERIRRFGAAFKRLRWWWLPIVAAGLALSWLGVWLGQQAFPVFEYRSCPVFSRLWAGVQFGLSLMLLWILLVGLSARRLFREPSV